METKQRASLPQFAEDKRVQSNPVLIAKYSKDGKLLAIVHTDLSLSLWDSEDLLVNTFEKSLFETRPKNRNNTHHVVFLDWSATNKYLYLIIDCSGFQIDVYSKSKRIHSFTYQSCMFVSSNRFDQPLNSFSAHPILDHFCIVTCLDQLIELNINIDKHLILLNYRDEVKTESARKSSIPSYAEYTGMDDTIILWLQAQLYLIKPDGTIVSSVQLKNSQPLQQRIRIDVANRRCIVACRNEIISYSLPKFEIESSYRDTVNDSPWKSIDYLAKEKMILALPDVYVSEGPTFYLIPSEGEIDSQIYRNPPERLSRGLIHPSGKELLFCDDAGGMILFRRVSETFVWSVTISSVVSCRDPCILIILRI